MDKDFDELIVNFGLPDIPTLKEYVESIQIVGNARRRTLNAPYGLVYAVAVVLAATARLLGKYPSIHPARIKKLVWQTYVIPKYLIEHGYPFQFTLRQALNDWKSEQPDDWK